MTPFSVQNLCIKMSAIQYLKGQSLVAEKFKFCTEFEKELKIEKGSYSEDIFDFVFNVYNFKKVYTSTKFKQLLSNFLDLNFLDFTDAKQFIENSYAELVFLNRDYFYSIFKFDHDDPSYIGQKFMENIKENHAKMIENF